MAQLWRLWYDKCHQNEIYTHLNILPGFFLAVSLVLDTVWKLRQQKVEEWLLGVKIPQLVCVCVCILLGVRKAAKWFSLRGRKVNIKVRRMGLSRSSSWISMHYLSPSVVLKFTSRITSILLSPPTGKECRAAVTFLSQPRTQAVHCSTERSSFAGKDYTAYTLPIGSQPKNNVIYGCGGFECFCQ